MRAYRQSDKCLWMCVCLSLLWARDLEHAQTERTLNIHNTHKTLTAQDITYIWYLNARLCPWRSESFVVCMAGGFTIHMHMHTSRASLYTHNNVMLPTYYIQMQFVQSNVHKQHNSAKTTYPHSNKTRARKKKKRREKNTNCDTKRWLQIVQGATHTHTLSTKKNDTPLLKAKEWGVHERLQPRRCDRRSPEERAHRASFYVFYLADLRVRRLWVRAFSHTCASRDARRARARNAPN